MMILFKLSIILRALRTQLVTVSRTLVERVIGGYQKPVLECKRTLVKYELQGLREPKIRSGRGRARGIEEQVDAAWCKPNNLP